ncbi:hypothetical protein RND71_016286 [Anisodus tanguticus]|uniref:G domain-containing protein n=1 Tax=Anisodus tanguticus TaxID=243964 RepID=A0AAE1VCJ4_9SOLA|nr:hypothetical protein RND71_016286 [Anisodus tanguticus]
MFITHLPKLHSHFSIFFYPKPKFLITSTLLSKSKTTPLSHFSSITATPNTLLQKTKNLEIEDVLEKPHIEISVEKLFFPPDTDVSCSGSRPLSSRILKGSNIVLSKYAGDAQVEQAEFVKSSVETEQCPSDGLPEFALVGRSNVGKSSLLNSLVKRKKLALTSKKPVSVIWRRYAAAPHEVRTDWAKFTKDYFLNRPTLVSVFLLIDASIPAKKIDLEYASWLGQNKIPMTLVFTKCDKRKKKKNGGKKPEENLQDFLELTQKFFQTAPPWIMTSSVTNQGRDEILLHMSQLRNYWLKH